MKALLVPVAAKLHPMDELYHAGAKRRDLVTGEESLIWWSEEQYLRIYEAEGRAILEIFAADDQFRALTGESACFVPVALALAEIIDEEGCGR